MKQLIRLYGFGVLVLGSLLLLAALAKFTDPQAFYDYLKAMGTRDLQVQAIAAVVIGGEVIAGIGLLLASNKLPYLWMSTCMLASFTAWNVFSFLNPAAQVQACACFGALDANTSPALSLIRSMVMTTVSALLCWMNMRLIPKPMVNQSDARPA